MIKVGLVGEDPNDTSSIKNLLDQRYKDRVQFQELAKRSTGTNLESLNKFKKIIKKKFDNSGCAFIVYITDLDAFESQSKEVDARINWFKEVDGHVKSKGLLLLNIWELEALIFGDIEAFNQMYSTKHKSGSNPMFIKEPKEVLMRLTSKSKKQFEVSHCTEIFKQLNIDTVEKNCSCFKKFITEFNEKLN